MKDSRNKSLNSGCDKKHYEKNNDQIFFTLYVKCQLSKIISILINFLD